MRMCYFWAQNGLFVLNEMFLVQAVIITFIYLLAYFIVKNFKKFLQHIQSYENGQFAPNIFFCKIINILIYLLALFIV